MPHPSSRGPDADATRLRTAGDLHACICAHAPRAAEASAVWERVVDLLERETGARRAATRPESSFVHDLHMDQRAIVAS